MNPPCFDPAPYAHLYAHEWAIDLRHAQILFAVCAWARPCVVVEVGSHRGASTAALVEAVRAGFVEELHCIEPTPPPELLEVLGRDPPRPHPTWSRIHLHQATVAVCAAFIGRAGFAFIDGDHGAPALADLAAFQAARTPLLALHDTNPAGPLAAQCWGAVEAGRRLQHDYHIAHDIEPRLLERTDRGLMVGARSFSGFIDQVQALMHRRAAWWPQGGPERAA